MQVPAGNGDRQHLAAARGGHQAAALIAAAHRFLGLVGDVMRIRQRPHLFIQVVGVYGAPVHKGHHRPIAQTAHLFLLRHPGQVARRGGLHRYRDVGPQGVGSGLAAKAAHLLLHRKGEAAVTEQLLTNHRQQHGAAGPVVQRAAGHTAFAVVYHRPGKGHYIPQGNQLFGLGLVLGADVDLHIADLARVTALFIIAQVHRLAAHHPGDGVITHQHHAAAGHLRLYAAYRRKGKEALFINVGDNKAHFVHMGGKLQHLFGRFFALFAHQQVAQRVYLILCVAFYLLDEILPDGSFPAAGAAQGAQSLNILPQLFVFHVKSPPLPPAPSAGRYSPRPQGQWSRPRYACSAAGWKAAPF